jgi:hypothetical protein
MAYPVNSAVITLTLSLNTFACTNISLSSNSGFQLTSCSSNTLVLTTNSGLSAGLVWVVFSVINYFSLKSGNTISLAVTGPAPSFYSIGAGSTTISLTVNNQSFVINNNNSTFGSATSITLS